MHIYIHICIHLCTYRDAYVHICYGILTSASSLCFRVRSSITTFRTCRARFRRNTSARNDANSVADADVDADADADVDVRRGDACDVSESESDVMENRRVAVAGMRAVDVLRVVFCIRVLFGVLVCRSRVVSCGECGDGGRPREDDSEDVNAIAGLLAHRPNESCINTLHPHTQCCVTGVCATLAVSTVVQLFDGA